VRLARELDLKSYKTSVVVRTLSGDAHWSELCILQPAPQRGGIDPDAGSEISARHLEIRAGNRKLFGSLLRFPDDASCREG
jgi:hypothetical protein